MNNNNIVRALALKILKTRYFELNGESYDVLWGVLQSGHIAADKRLKVRIIINQYRSYTHDTRNS